MHACHVVSSNLAPLLYLLIINRQYKVHKSSNVTYGTCNIYIYMQQYSMHAWHGMMTDAYSINWIACIPSIHPWYRICMWQIEARSSQFLVVTVPCLVCTVLHTIMHVCLYRIPYAGRLVSLTYFFWNQKQHLLNPVTCKYLSSSNALSNSDPVRSRVLITEVPLISMLRWKLSSVYPAVGIYTLSKRILFFLCITRMWF